jgi:hypothetical protein
VNRRGKALFMFDVVRRWFSVPCAASIAHNSVIPPSIHSVCVLTAYAKPRFPCLSRVQTPLPCVILTTTASLVDRVYTSVEDVAMWVRILIAKVFL